MMKAKLFKLKIKIIAGVVLFILLCCYAVTSSSDSNSDNKVADSNTTNSVSSGENSAEIEAILESLDQTHYDSLVYLGGKLPSPFPTAVMIITSMFGTRTHPVTGKKGTNHGGMDLCTNNRWSPILAVASGIVTVGNNTCTHNDYACSCGGGYGNYIIINHGTYRTLYGHLSKVLVTNGQVVRAGDVIGIEGSTGRSTGNHLHFEVRAGTTRIDPYPFLFGGT